MRILLLDDDAFALKVTGHQLSRLGFDDVTAIASPQEALQLLETDVTSFDLILLDLQMPEMDGIEFIRHLGRLRFAGDLALVSGEDERILQTAHRLARAHQLQVRGALRKPISPEQLQSILGTSAAPVGARRGPRTEKKAYSAERVAQAIAARELVNVYQPQVDMRTGALVGVETLVRWKHPEDGMVFPDQFITIAEENHLIDDLTRAVLEAAVVQARAWQVAGLGVRVGVNISMDNLSSLDFPDFVARAISAAGTANDLIVLEVTESRLMSNAVSALDILTRLRLKKIGVSIDDFGTGHSSLAQLRDIPFDELKVDRSFVHGAGADPSNKAILRASLGMARQLDMRSVGEGVEDREDWDTLRRLGCDLAQGYFIAKPMPPDAMTKWHAEWEARRQELVS